MWVLESSDQPPLTLRLPPGSVKTIGRAVQADFIVDAALMSRVHCRLTASDSNELIVQDLDSTNGILVNGERIDRTALKVGDVLTVGRIEFRVSRPEA
jgi:ABC transport system ATP-binding/permease protein